MGMYRRAIRICGCFRRPGGITERIQKVYLKSDTAAYQKELLIYCAEGRNERFRVIEFAVGVDVTAEFKKAVAAVEEKEWHPLEREIEDGYWLPDRNGQRFVLYLPGPLAAKGAWLSFPGDSELLDRRNSRGWKCSYHFHSELG